MSPLGRMLVAFSIVLILFGCICSGVGGMLFYEGQSTEAEPQELTLQQLIENGYGDNAHVLLTDVQFADNYVVEERPGGSWENAWFPLLPADADSEAIRVVLKSNRVSGDDAADDLMVQDRVQGVVSMFGSLGADETKLLQEDFPNTDFEKCYVMRHVDFGHTEPPAAFALCCVVPGVLLLLTGAGVIVFSVRAGMSGK